MASQTYTSPGMGRVKVRCPNQSCRTEQFVSEDYARTMGGWQCSESTCRKTYSTVGPYKV